MRPLITLPLLLLCVAACGEIEPEDPLFVYGEVRDSAGAPVAGKVELWRSTCTMLDCGVDPALDRFERFSEIKAGSDGTWVGEVTYYDTFILQGGGLTPLRTWMAVVQPDPLEPPVRATFAFVKKDADLPPLQQWTTPVLSLGSEGLAITFASPPELIAYTDPLGFKHPHTSRTGLALTDASGEEVWFVSADAAGTVDLPLEVLEDFTHAARPIREVTGSWAEPEATVLGFTGTTEYVLRQDFEAVPLSASAPRVPVSRGRPCSPLEPVTFEPRPLLVPCAITDGDPSTFARADLESDGHAPWFGGLAVELAGPTQVSRVIVRNVVTINGGSVRVEGRPVGSTGWLLLEETQFVDPELLATEPDPSAGIVTSSSFLVTAPTDLPPLEAIRVVTGLGVQDQAPLIFRLGELSVF